MHAACAVIALAALALAGCTGPAAPPPEAAPAEAPFGCSLDLLMLRGPAQPCNVEVTTANGPASEVHLAVNPADPLNFVVGAKDFTLQDAPGCDAHNVWAGQYWSHDGGRTWGNALIQGHPGDTRSSSLAPYRCSSDPVMAFGPDGTAYYFGIGVEPTSDQLAPALGRLGGAASALWVAASRDGGATYEDPVFIHKCQAPACFDDKQWVAVDANDGTLYLSWALIAPLVQNPVIGGFATGHIVMSRSDDGGRTWSLPVDVSPPMQLNVINQGNTPAVGPDGDVYVTWIDFINNQLLFAASADRGGTWSQPQVIAAITTLPGNLPNSEFRTPTLTTMAVDRSDQESRGAIYIAWSDYGAGNADVLLVRSDDGGATWSAPFRANGDLGEHDQFFPSVSVAPDGRLDVLFYDRRDDPGNRLLTPYYAYSRDQGATMANLRLGDVLFDGDLGYHQTDAPYIGDYIGIASTARAAYAVWADSRNGDNDVFTATVLHP